MFTVEMSTSELASQCTRAEAILLYGLGPAVMTACAEGAGEAIRVHTYTDRHPGTGLTSRIFAQMTGRGSHSADGEIVADKPYAKYVEEGTRAHVIEAKDAYALRWQDASGGVHFAKRVNHPGSRSFPFMGPAYLKSERVLETEINRLVERMRAVLESE